MDEEGAVRLQHQQPDSLREDGIQASRVDDLAAGNDEAHSATVPSQEDMSRKPGDRL